METIKIKRRIIQSITAKNNRSSRQETYTNTRGNKCGLSWKINGDFLTIQQVYVYGGKHWYAIALLTEHSVIGMKWKIIEVDAEQSKEELIQAKTFEEFDNIQHSKDEKLK